ncbi:MAG: hypothetical protein OEZ38_05085 [Gammaproteobacteria bacterium]|nr:hypothetical protein [Gammaproteobacteria bacterium]
MSYDRAEWHYEGDYPEDLPSENGGTHIGMFLAWIIINNLEGKVHQLTSQESLEAVRNKTITGREFLVKECEDRLMKDDMNEQANAFTRFYYESDVYFSDYASTLAKGLPSLYHVEDTWENYERLEPVIMQRFIKWQVSRSTG